jgi:hypothetical protein
VYFRYGSGTCGGVTSCNFRGVIRTLPGFDQVEVFLCGFTLETLSQADKVGRVAARVQKFRYDRANGALEVGVSAGLSTTGQKYSYELTFVVVLTGAKVAKFTRIDASCGGVETCTIGRSLPAAVPSGMHYIGLGTSSWDLGSNAGAFPLNTLSGHIDSISVAPPTVNLTYLAAFRDAAGGKRMFLEWDAAVIAFRPSEMAQNTSPIFPQYTMLAHHVTTRQFLGSGGTAPVPAIRGVLDAFEGLTLFYDNPAIEHDIWLVEASASAPRLTAPNAAAVDLGLFLGTTFGDRTNAPDYAYQESRALGFLL